MYNEEHPSYNELVKRLNKTNNELYKVTMKYTDYIKYNMIFYTLLMIALLIVIIGQIVESHNILDLIIYSIYIFATIVFILFFIIKFNNTKYPNKPTIVAQYPEQTIISVV